ncbi:MAG: hydantoinase B/oxoprolinase family protein, partial [Alphaproteobacteria bacterium]
MSARASESAPSWTAPPSSSSSTPLRSFRRAGARASTVFAISFCNATDEVCVDAISVGIIRNKVSSLVEEMHYHFYRSGYSTIIRESRDFS